MGDIIQLFFVDEDARVNPSPWCCSGNGSGCVAGLVFSAVARTSPCQILFCKARCVRAEERKQGNKACRAIGTPKIRNLHGEVSRRGRGYTIVKEHEIKVMEARRSLVA